MGQMVRRRHVQAFFCSSILMTCRPREHRRRPPDRVREPDDAADITENCVKRVKSKEQALVLGADL